MQVCLGLLLSLQLAAVSQPQLPEPQIHPLPATLAQWTAPDGSALGDYFDAVQPTELGYLVWSKLPVQVYIQAAEADAQSQAWYAAVTQALQDWTVYLPLALATDPETADIQVLQTAPPIQLPAPSSVPGADPIAQLPRIRSAETRYEFFQRRQADSVELFQRFTIQLSPSQTANYMLATARHELGHALGIWGHSPQPTDALYFSQVSQPAAISARDIRTLKRIYQQPTRLGWRMPTQAVVKTVPKSATMNIATT
jgi:predicted Zn-dependent protease